MRWIAGVLTAGLLTGAALAAPAPQALDLNDPKDALAASRKFLCSTRDGEPMVYQWTGRAYSRVPGERDRLLFDVEGMSVRQCVTVADPQRGTGYRLVSRELMFYLDPRTGEVLRTWTNPWTNQAVEVLHVANDPVNQRPSFERSADGAPYRFPGRIDGSKVLWAIEVPLFYENPLGGDYQEAAGNQYHALEIFDFIAERGHVLDRRTRTADSGVAWVRIAPWLPWMNMGSRPGVMVFNATGHEVAGIDALPDVVRREIAERYPAWREPPSGDDTRPNATSWTEYKKRIDARRGTKPSGPGAPQH
jgi:hypothetical protein